MTTRDRIVIGTRGSALARWQADHVAAQIAKWRPGVDVVQEIIVTSGDRFQAGPVADVGGKAVWVKEIEDALVARTIDLAVHSLKDVPTESHPTLLLAGFPLRADARDALVSRVGKSVATLPSGTRVGTSSIRRACQLRALRPELEILPLRGNVDTRLRKVDEGVVDAALLASAGLDRLGYGMRIKERVAVDEIVPAAGQGALALQVSAADARMVALCKQLNDDDTEIAVCAERAVLLGLGGSCRTPIAAHAQILDGRLQLVALVGRPDGSRLLRASVSVAPNLNSAVHAGRTVAEELLGQGANDILREFG